MPPKLLLRCLLLTAAIGSTMAGAQSASVLKGITYETPAGARKMDIYLPGISGTGAPCVIWIGKDEPGARDHSVCSDLVQAGFVVALIASEPDSTPSDRPVLIGKCAVRFIRASAERLRVDERRIAIAGSSAAGAYALLVAFTRSEPRFAVNDLYPGVSDRVDAVITLSAMTDWRVPEVKGWPPEALEELRVLSPVTYVTAEAPAVLIFHGTRDKSVPDSHATILAKLLVKANVPHRLVRLDGIGHTFSLTAANGRPLPEDVKGICISFLRDHLAKLQ
jgi:dienelactone hydrolase